MWTRCCKHSRRVLPAMANEGHMFLNIPAVACVEPFLETLKERPPWQVAEGSGLQQTIEQLNLVAAVKQATP